jgi:single-strand DNA-binding protein
MASYNRVILMGNLTRDPELKTLPSQTVVCDFALAVNRRWKDTDGADREEVLFIDCAAFGKTGQTIGESLTKGRPIHIEGRLKFEQWEQEDGQRRNKIRVVVEQFRFVDRKPDASQPAERNGRGKRRSNGRKSAACAARPQCDCPCVDRRRIRDVRCIQTPGYRRQ